MGKRTKEFKARIKLEAVIPEVTGTNPILAINFLLFSIFIILNGISVPSPFCSSQPVTIENYFTPFTSCV